MEKSIDVVICLGKTPNPDGSLDPILQGRVDLAYKIAVKNNARLLLSGGKNLRILKTKELSESAAMQKYVVDTYNTDSVKIILEEKGSSTISQLCIIKNEILIPKKWFTVALVTDEIHLERALITTQWILGDDFTITPFGSKVKVSEEKRKAYIARENEKIQLTRKNFAKNFKKGDDKKILNYDRIYTKAICAC